MEWCHYLYWKIKLIMNCSINHRPVKKWTSCQTEKCVILKGAVQIICNIKIPPNNVCKNAIKYIKDCYYLSVKATLNRCVLERIKMFKTRRISNICRQLIPQSGAATLNAQSPYNLSRNTGTCNSIWLDDLSFGDDFLVDTSSHKYSGAISLIDL